MLYQEGDHALITQPGQNGQEGFTLLELLLAIFIFTIVISSVYGAYRATFRITNSTESQAEYYNMARIALERITGDLESSYAGNGGLLRGERKEGDTGGADQLTFTSTSHLIFSRKEQPAGYAMIRYSTEKDEESGLQRLYRADKAYRPGDTQAIDDEQGFLLCDSLAEVRFAYFDADGNENDEWRSDEDGGLRAGGAASGKFPAMIKITLRFAESDETEERTVFTTAVALSRSIQATTP